MPGHLLRWWLLTVVGGLLLLGLTAAARAVVDHLQMRRRLSRRARTRGAGRSGSAYGRRRHAGGSRAPVGPEGVVAYPDLVGYSAGKKMPISRAADSVESEPWTRF